MTFEGMPVLPYPDGEDRSSGWSGSETSHERAQARDTSGETGRNQAQLRLLLMSRAGRGATWAEVSEYFGWHHGVSSGLLSNLHKAGLLARLTERRNRCAVYVLPEHVDGRETRRYGRTRVAMTAEPVQAPRVLTLAERASAAWLEDYLEGYPTASRHYAVVLAALERLG